MTKREVAALACKLMGIFTFILGLISLPFLLWTFWVAWANSPGVTTHMSLVLCLLNTFPVLVYFLAAVLLWKGAGRLSGQMVASDGTPLVPLKVDQDVQRVAFTFLGLFSIVGVIPRAVQIFEHLYMERHMSAALHPSWQPSIAPEVVKIVIQLALGLGLLFGASELEQWLHSFRTAKPGEEPA